MLISGKLIRMGFLFVWVFSIFNFIDQLAGYSLAQTLLFFATFNLVDILAQIFFFRGFWFVQTYVKEGEFDRLLLYPISEIFLTALKITDWMDVLTLLPAISLVVYAVSLLPVLPSFLQILLYLLLCFNGVLIAFGLNLFIASLTFYTSETENLFLLYRDLMTVGRFPTEIFSSPLQLLFTFVFPVAVIIAFPAKVLLGILSPAGILYAFILSLALLFLALKVWKISLRRYSSASS
jgi:ABC-2 type transport system permease protein